MNDLKSIGNTGVQGAARHTAPLAEAWMLLPALASCMPLLPEHYDVRASTAFPASVQSVYLVNIGPATAEQSCPCPVRWQPVYRLSITSRLDHYATPAKYVVQLPACMQTFHTTHSHLGQTSTVTQAPMSADNPAKTTCAGQ